MDKTHSRIHQMVLLPSGVLIGLSLAIGFTSMAENTELDSGPRAIPYNGILEFNGQALNGQADLQFTLTDVPGGEGANCLFEEEHDNITAYAGRFSVNIGSVTGDLPDCVFDSDAMYIEVAVRDATANEDEDDTNDDYVTLTGSQRIHPVPFSYWAAEGSDFKVDGDLKVTGAIQDPVDSVVEIDSAVDVSGALVNSSVNDLDEDQPLFINDDLAISGELSDSDGTLFINDDAAIANSLNAQGRVFNSTNTNDGNVYIGDDLRVEKSAHIGYDGEGTLTVDGNTNLKSSLFNGGSSNGGRLYIADELDVEGNTTIGSDGSGDLTVNGTITASGNIQSSGDTVTINDKLNINGQLILQDAVIDTPSDTVLPNTREGCVRLDTMQMCWGTLDVEGRDAGSSTTFQKSFGNSLPAITATAIASTERIVTVNGLSTTGFTAHVYNQDGNARAAGIHYTAFGLAGSGW